MHKPVVALTREATLDSFFYVASLLHRMLFAIGRKLEQWQHQRLKVRNSQVVLPIFSYNVGITGGCKPSGDGLG